MTDSRAAALEILRTLVGRDDADFHDGQFEAIETLVDQRRRALVVQRVPHPPAGQMAATERRF